jgi:DtxR family Mn-dependent transcriptional regulator
LTSRSIGDYLKTIYSNLNGYGYARTSDISSALGVQPPSVTEMLQKLHRNKLVSYEKRKGVKLTPYGERLARSIQENNLTLKKFFAILGIRRDVADEDACSVEHHLNPETAKCLRRFVKFVEDAPKDPEWLRHYRQYCATGKHPCEQDKLSLKNFNNS